MNTAGVVLIATVVIVAGLMAIGVNLGDRVFSRRKLLIVSGLLSVVGLVGLALPAPGEANLVTTVILVVVLGCALVGWVALWSSSDRDKADDISTQVRQWAESYGVPLGDTNVGFLTSYVREGHQLRLVCGIGGAAAIIALTAGLGFDLFGGDAGWFTLLIGYLVGVVWSQAWLARLPAGTERAASLQRRGLSDYLRRFVMVAQIGAPVVAVGVALVSLFAQGPVDDTGALGGWSAASLHQLTIGIAGAAVVLSIAVGLLQRHIVRRARPVDDPGLAAADDAVRSNAVQLLGGTTTAMIVLGLSTQLVAAVALGWMPTDAGSVAAIACYPLALWAWRFMGKVPMRVSRSEARPAPTAPVPEGASS